MANGFLETLEVRPWPERGLLGFGLGLGGAALAAVTVAAAPPPWKILACGVIAVALGLELCGRWSPSGAGAVRRAVLWRDGSWQLMAVGRAEQPVPARLVHCWGRQSGPIIALEWACADGRRHQAWLHRRATPPDTWRRLRVRLRLA